MRKSWLYIVIFVLIVGFILFALQFIRAGNKIASDGASNLVGSDRDEHGCVLSAGYSWCDVSAKCIRPWEEACGSPTPSIDETENLKVAVKKALIEKHGQSAQSLVISVTQVIGNYAKGMVNDSGAGGGIWFAAKTNGEWTLVWDGNGIIVCKAFSKYPDFPSELIPQCFDEARQKMITR